MATIIKLKKKPPVSGLAALAPKRAPVRGSGAGVKSRPTLAEAQSLRAEREAAYRAQSPPERSNAQSPPASPARRDERRPRRPDHRPDARPDAPAYARPAAPTAPRAVPRPPASGPARSPAQPAPASAQALRRPFDRGGPHVYRGHARPGAGDAHDADDDDDNHRDLHPEHPPGSMRLSKRMSELGISSRREADEWIAKGWVRVDDQVVSALGSRVLPGQRVTVDAQAKYQQAQKVTVLVNKPVGYVSGQAEDGYEPALVLVTPANQWRDDRSGTRFLREHTKNLVPAGRLDIDSVGLLVLTQDGRIAKQLIGEESDIEKEYLVRVAAPAALPSGAGNERVGRDNGGAPVVLPERDLERLRHGLELDGEALLPATVEWVNADQLRFVLRQGKKRQIRRMCEAVGLQVLGLKRVRIGQVMLGDLPAGQWRYLRREEGF